MGRSTTLQLEHTMSFYELQVSGYHAESLMYVLFLQFEFSENIFFVNLKSDYFRLIKLGKIMIFPT